jgi:hypothetical protein
MAIAKLASFFFAGRELLIFVEGIEMNIPRRHGRRRVPW